MRQRTSTEHFERMSKRFAVRINPLDSFCRALRVRGLVLQIIGARQSHPYLLPRGTAYFQGPDFASQVGRWIQLCSFEDAESVFSGVYIQHV